MIFYLWKKWCKYTFKSNKQKNLSWRSVMKIAGSISQRHTSADSRIRNTGFFICHFCNYLIWSTIVFRILPSHLQRSLLAKNIVLQCRFRETCNLRRLFGTRYLQSGNAFSSLNLIFFILLHVLDEALHSIQPPNFRTVLDFRFQE